MQDPLLANKLSLNSIFFLFIHLLKKCIWRGESSNPITSRMDKESSASRTQSNIQEQDFSEISQRPRAINYFPKELDVRCSNGFWIRFWPRHRCFWTEIHWVNILVHVTQVFIENTAPNFQKPSTKDEKYKNSQQTFNYSNSTTEESVRHIQIRGWRLTWMTLTSSGSLLI